MAFQRMGSGGSGGTLTISAYGTYSNGNTIDCEKGDIIVFVCNPNGMPTLENLTIVYSYSALITGSDYAKMFICQSTDTSCSATFTLYYGSSKILYTVISK